MIVEGTLPDIGEEVTLPVVPSATRTTIFPERTVIATAGKEAVELIFLRNELFVASEQATVKGTSEGTAELQMKSAIVGHQVCDLGHVRMNSGVAVDMAISILTHAKTFGLLKDSEIRSKLTKAGFKAK